mmetsp:Transcript_254/g.323  ORF Transcript_254/g.323 Transcript_254/m.323 type:complete len:89 (+) Transcript_254:1323-1589(+)
MSDDNAVEDARHYMCQCGYEDYQRIKSAWCDKVKVRIRGDVARDTWCNSKSHVIRNGMLENYQDAQDDSELTVLDVTSGRIPELWTKM